MVSIETEKTGNQYSDNYDGYDDTVFNDSSEQSSLESENFDYMDGYDTSVFG